MARKRMIDPNIWQSEDFSKLSTLAKLVFIGLFSQADDEGRGRANPTYIKSTIFPYEEGMRSADIDKTLSEISSNMSVIFYSCDGSSYYSLYNWNKWQKIDKPKASEIPEFDEENENIRRLFVEESSTIRRQVPPNKNKNKNKNKNRIEEEKNKKETDFDKVISENFSDEELKKTVYEFIEMRQAIKKPLTKRGLELMIKKLYELSTNATEQIEILNNSIMNNWQGIFPLKKEYNKGNKGKIDDFIELWEEAGHD